MSRRAGTGCSVAATLLLVVAPVSLQAAPAPAAHAVPGHSVPGHSVPDKSVLTTLLARLRQHDTVKVGFTQLKTLRILKKPLQSAGSLVFWRGKGMLWQVTEPVAATYVLNVQGMREVTQAAGSAAPLATNSAAPNLLPLFDAIFAGDEAALAQHFDYRISGTAQAWQLNLVPRDAMLQRIFSRLELDGRDYIDRITLFDTRGDQTRIELHAPQFGKDRLSADETSLLQ